MLLHLREERRMLLWPTEGQSILAAHHHNSTDGRWWCAIDHYKEPIPVGAPIADQRGRIFSGMIQLLAQQSDELLKLYGYSSGVRSF
jgi:hypothetical protein